MTEVRAIENESVLSEKSDVRFGDRRCRLCTLSQNDGQAPGQTFRTSVFRDGNAIHEPLA